MPNVRVDGARAADAGERGFSKAVGGDAAVFGLRDGRFYRFRPPGALTELTATPTVSTSGGVSEGDVTFLADRQGVVHRATFDGDVVRTASIAGAPVEADIARWVDGRVDGDTLVEAFGLMESGHLVRYSPPRWTLIEQLPEATKGGIAYVGPGAAIAGGGTATNLTLVRDGVATSIPFGDDGITMVHRGRSGTIYVASGAGVLDRFDPTTDTRAAIGNAPIALDIYSLAETPTGFVYGGAFGFFGEYVEGLGFCPAAQVGSSSIRQIAPVADGYLLTGDRRTQDTETVAVWVE